MRLRLILQGGIVRYPPRTTCFTLKTVSLFTVETEEVTRFQKAISDRMTSASTIDTRPIWVIRLSGVGFIPSVMVWAVVVGPMLARVCGRTVRKMLA